MRKLFPLLMLTTVLVSSCTIHKRLYSSGFYIAANQHQNTTKNAASVRDESETHPGNDDGVQTDMTDNDSPKANTGAVHKRDIPDFKDVAIKCSSLSSPGSFAPTNTKSSTWKKFEIKPKQSKAKNKYVPDEGKSGDKSQLVAFLLCFFFGLLGIHRFYLGYVGIGLLELFTLGCFGILTLIDLFLIAFGVLKPKNGNYK